MTKIKVTDYIVSFLHGKGVKQVFELSGGMITHLLDSLCVQNQVQAISVHHEQSAAFAAEACGRMTGIPGIAMATSGPGATNLLTGIGSCYFDSSPSVFITGQVNRNEQKRDRAIRQLGFQETDIVSMAKPVTKWAVGIETPEEIPAALERAFTEATTGRPGPVLLDIPMDVQRGIIEDGGPVPVPTAQSPAVDIGPLLAAIASSKRPLILAGGGLRTGRAVAMFRRLVDILGIPVVHSLMGADALPFAHPSRVGMIGTYGNRWANLAMISSDLLIVLGSRLDVRQTGSRTEAFARGRMVFHVDCEAGEINNRVRNCHGVVSEIGPFLEQMVAACANTGTAGRYAPWLAKIAELRQVHPDTEELRNLPGINPNVFMHQLSRQSRNAGAYVVDVGQHQMWAAQSLELGADQRLLTSGGMGSMGFALPAAIGASLCMSGGPVVVIAGDGSFQCNIQELQTVSRLNLPLKIVVANNQCHGMVRQFQESYFGGRYQSTYLGYSAPDFTKVSSAYGIDSVTVTGADDVEGSLQWLWRDPERPQLLQVMIDTFANAYPKVTFGQPVSDMDSYTEPAELVPIGSLT